MFFLGFTVNLKRLLLDCAPSEQSCTGGCVAGTLTAADPYPQSFMESYIKSVLLSGFKNVRGINLVRVNLR